MPFNYFRQLRTVFIVELGILIFGMGCVYIFWNQVCDSTLLSCLRNERLSLTSFFFFSLLRPFVLTPLALFALMAGNNFGPYWGTLVTAMSALLSCVSVYIFGKIIGKKLVNPWLSSNLPQTFKFIRSQDWKITLAIRLVPFLPFDFCTLVFGILDFRWKYIMISTFVGILPEAFILSQAGDPTITTMTSTVSTLAIVSCFMLLPGIIVEFISRKHGSGLWVRAKAMWNEIFNEIKLNNSIIKRHVHDPKKQPILLLYGFFSSRRSLTVMERILTFRGYEVISFNLGGLFGVFFTKDIPETASFIDYKIRRQFERHKFEKINIIAHSKGGLVALWWLLKLGGHRYCKTVITLGTPYKGTNLTWLGILTFVGLIFKDLWQMRPGSSFLRELHESKIPDDVYIYNMYSEKDRVARGKNGIFEPKEKSDRVLYVPMHHISHFEFLYRRDVGDTLARLLGSPYIDSQTSEGSRVVNA